MAAPGFGLAAAGISIAPELADTLKTTSLFKNLGESELVRIVAQAKLVAFEPEQVLFLQGQPVRNLALIAKGKVKLLQSSAKGDEVLMWASTAGDVLGLMAGDQSSVHTCTARVLEGGNAWLWNHNRVVSLLKDYPQLAANLAQILSNRLAELEERFREVATEPVSRRIALVLLRLSKKVGAITEEGLYVRLSREDLARMSGTTLFTVSRVISRWAEQGLIGPRRSAVVVTDLKMLQWIALRGE